MTMTWQHSDYDTASSSAFELLDPKIQKWIWNQKWGDLRGIQERAIKTILLNDDHHVIISAPTARGKTEAAFLPICSKISSEDQPSIRALYVSPLKALINDQFNRLDFLCDDLNIEVVRWHGDVAASVKHKCIKKPRGILLTTPESLEAICINQGSNIAYMFRHLSYVVIDELHAFIGTERGKQLQSLLHRLERAIDKVPMRIGLSATLGDSALAENYLDLDSTRPTISIVDEGDHQEIQAQIRGYIEKAAIGADTVDDDTSDNEDENQATKRGIASHLFSTLRQTDNLIFANSRQNVEQYAALLASMCEDNHLPVNFFPHHGNLSKELREDVERMLKNTDARTNVVCTSTLELGIDIGDMESVAQIGVPHSVSSLRQRLGRSGRRGNKPAVLRMYETEHEITPNTGIADCLRMDLVQSVAALGLLIEGWCEPPRKEILHLSTFVQQFLSVIAQYGGAGLPFMWSILCEKGAFRRISKDQFKILVRGFAERELIAQTGDGIIVLGKRGETLVSHYSFYAAFSTPEEYRVFHKSHQLGTLPVEFPLIVDSFIIFAGKKWKITSVDLKRKVVDLTPAPGGKVPHFAGTGELDVHERLHRKMNEVYEGAIEPAFLNQTAKSLLREARDGYRRYDLSTQRFVCVGSDCYLFHWGGSVVGRTLRHALESKGFTAYEIGPSILVDKADEPVVREALSSIVALSPESDVDLVRNVVDKRIDKFDEFVADEILEEGYAKRMIDLEAGKRAVERLLAQ